MAAKVPSNDKINEVFSKGIGSDMVWLLNETDLTGDKNVEVYDKLGVSYEEYMKMVDSQSPKICGETVAKYITENRENVEILDIGAGTGLVGDTLYQHGFRLIDGLDPSKGMLEVAEKKKKYRTLYCEFFTPEPTSLKENSYDAICMSAAIGGGDIPTNSVYEMLRLTKPGGILCLISKKVTLQEILPYMEKLEKEKKLKKIDIFETEEYSNRENDEENKKKRMKIPKGKPETENRRRIDNTMARKQDNKTTKRKVNGVKPYEDPEKRKKPVAVTSGG